MKNAYYLLSIFLLLSSPYVFAKRISPEQSLAVAEKIVQSHSELRSGKELKLVYSAYGDNHSLRSNESSALFHVYNIGEQGFVIVAGDDAAYPVIGYSFNGIFEKDKIADNFKFFLEMTEEHISYRIEHQIAPSQQIVNAWNEYLSDNPDESPLEENIGPLMTTKWGQSYPYNLRCPKINGENTLSGCITTVLMQLMKYWAHPTRGTGSTIGYYSSKSWVASIDFSKQTYDWDLMNDVYKNTPASQESMDEVAKFTYHAAVSIYSDFGLTSTYANVAELPRALINYFYYDLGIRQYDRAYYQLSDWEDVITRELRESRPVLMRGENRDRESHVYICDGKDSRGSFHFNWGWEGRWDGFYSMENFYDMDRTALPSEYKFYNKMTMMGGIQPDKGSPIASIISLNEKTSLYSAKDSVKKNEVFIARAQFKNNGFKNYRGDYYIVLTNSKNEILAQLASVSSNVVLTSGSSSREFQYSCAVPSDVRDGSYTIRAAVKDPDSSDFYLMEAIPGYIDSLPLEVKGSLPLSVRIGGGNTGMKVGETKQLSAVIFPSDVDNSNIIWSSSDPKVVEIDQKGFITAKAAGTTVIKVMMEEGGLFDSYEVSVENNYPVFSDPEVLIFDNSFMRQDESGSIEIFLKIPESEYFSGSFIITLPDGFVLNTNLSSFFEEGGNEFEIQNMLESDNSWLIKISGKGNIPNQTKTSGYLKIMNLVYDAENVVHKGPYEALISDLIFNYEENNSLSKSDIAFYLLLDDPTQITSLSAEVKLYLRDGMLIIDSPYPEQIKIYSVTGNLLNTIEKTAGQITVKMKNSSDRLFLVRGSSGWTKKLVVR